MRKCLGIRTTHPGIFGLPDGTFRIVAKSRCGVTGKHRFVEKLTRLIDPTMTLAQAVTLRSNITNEIVSRKTEVDLNISSRVSHIYLIQVAPDLNPNRLKIGFSSRDLLLRLNEFKTVAPTLKLLKFWRGSRLDEKIAHSKVPGRISTEVFHCPPSIALKLLNEMFEAKQMYMSNIT